MNDDPDIKSPRQASKRMAEILVETLQAASVQRRYEIVGDTLNRIAHAIDASEIEWVCMRHEEAAAFAAGAEAQLNRAEVRRLGSGPYRPEKTRILAKSPRRWGSVDVAS